MEQTGPSLQDCVEARKQLGLRPRSINPDDGYTVAVLVVNDTQFYGKSGRQKELRSFRINAISRDHAERDAVDQYNRHRLDANVSDKQIGYMAVDREPCDACGKFGGLRRAIEQSGLAELYLLYPGGSSIIKSAMEEI